VQHRIKSSPQAAARHAKISGGSRPLRHRTAADPHPLLMQRTQCSLRARASIGPSTARMSTTASVVSVAGRLAIASPARTVSRVKESFILRLRIDKIVLGVGRNDSLKKLLLIF